MPHDSPLPRVNTLGSDDGSMTLQELMVLCTTLSQKVKSLKADLKQTKQVYGAAYTKLIIKVKRIEKIVKKSKARRQEKLGVLSAAKVLADAAKVHTYTRRRRVVNTGSDGIKIASRIVNTAKETVSTAGASMPISTAGMIDKAMRSINDSVPIESEDDKAVPKLAEDGSSKRDA
nr:hypothetical protein [Tanacetum cinerariifolium]